MASMDNDEYYDLDHILAEQCKIPCLFNEGVDPGFNLTGDARDLSQKTKAEIPFWMAAPLARLTLADHTRLVEIEIPASYGTRARNALEASPASVDFRLLNPYFYVLGIKMVSLLVDEELPMILENSFKARLLEIMNYSQTGTTGVGQDFLQKLDETEKQLFKAGKESTMQLRYWRSLKKHHLRSVDISSRPSS